MVNTGAIHGFPNASYEAEADISQFRVVKLGTSANQVITAGAGEAGIGIAQANVDISTGDVAIAVREDGFSFAIAGVGGRTRGDKLKVDASGGLVTATASTDIVVAEARNTVSATEQGEVIILKAIALGLVTLPATEVIDPTTPAPTADAVLYTMTPTASKSIPFAVVPPAGTVITLKVLTSGTSTFTLTFSTNVTSTGTLATGTADAKTFVLQFVSDGTTLFEVSRTAAM